MTGEWGRLWLAAGLCAAATFGFFAYQQFQGVELAVSRTSTLTLALILELLLALSARSRGPLWRIDPLGNPWLLAAVGVVGALHLLLLYTPAGRILHLVPLPLATWPVIGGLALLVFAVFEVSKLLRAP